MSKPSANVPFRKRLLFAGFGIGLSIFIAALVGELALRILPIPGISFHSFKYNELTGGRYYPQTKIVYRNKRGDSAQRTSNAFGFLDKDHSEQKPENTVRIGFFGDSYTEAQQVPLENTFHQLVERDLSGTNGRKVECLSFGVSGYSTLQSSIECSEFADKFDLDYVVYVFVENDPGDQIREIKRSDAIPVGRLDKDTVVTDNSFRDRYRYKTSQPHRTLQFVKSRSLLLSTVVSRWKLLKERGIKTKVTEEDRTLASPGRKGELPREGTLLSTWPPELRERTAQIGEQVLARWIDDVRSEGREFVVVYIPREAEVGMPLESRDGWGLWLHDLCLERSVPRVDPSQAFHARNLDGVEMYYDHLTIEGHKALAGVITAYFRGQSL